MAVSDHVIAAICGNWWAESAINSNIWESTVAMSWDYIYSNSYPNHGGFGFGQWTNTSRSSMRLKKMHDWVISNGYADGDPVGQLNYFIEENVWAPKGSGYSSLSRFLASTSTDTRALAETFLNCWEGWTSADARKYRGDNAVIFYNIIQSNKNKTGWTWYTPYNNYPAGQNKKYYATGCNPIVVSFGSISNMMKIRNWFNGDDTSYEPVPDGEHTITINVQGNGEAFPSSPVASQGTIIDIYATPYDDDAFEGWSVQQGGVEVEFTLESPSWWRFTMGIEDVIILARFTGQTPEEHEKEDVPQGQLKNKIAYQIPWWAKYGL